MRLLYDEGLSAGARVDVRATIGREDEENGERPLKTRGVVRILEKTALSDAGD